MKAKVEQDKVAFLILYNSYYAFVDASFVGEEFYSRQSLESWKTRAILELIADGKQVQIEDSSYFKFKCSDLEKEFLKIAKRIPVTEWGLWRKIVNKLAEGQSKQEVLNWVMTEAIARGLTS